MQIHVTLTGDDNALPQKLADAEIRFNEGPLAGLRLIGFSVQKGRKPGSVIVKLPARVYSVAGDRREFALMRPLNAERTIAALEAALLEAYGDAVAQRAREQAAAGETGTTPRGE